MKSTTEKKIAAILSIITNAGIILLKFLAGAISGSISIISEAIHSMSDCLASILTFFAVSRSSEPADKDHPFGHGKYEDMSGFIEGGLIVFAGLFIVYKSLTKLILNQQMNSETSLGITVMIISIITNWVVSNYLLQVAKKTDSISLFADGEHLRADIFSSAGVLIGLILIKLTGITILDPIIALIVAFFIIKTGYQISKETLNNLLDGSLPENDIQKIETILTANKEIKGFKNLRARKSGQIREIEITVFFDPHIRICECHNMCDNIETQMGKILENTRIHIHPEPICYEQNCKNSNCIE
ncbi:cation transporter [bacterium]|nr:cation transporter [bacterium]